MTTERERSLETNIKLRWLGVAGLELGLGSTVLAFDPFFTRPSLWQVAFGRMRPNADLAAAILPRCDYILITHAHYDHLMDVPAVVEATSAEVYGSSNACRLLETLDVPRRQIREIAEGDRLVLGEVEIDVFQDEHRTIFGMRVACGSTRLDIKQPLRFSDFRMDSCFSFHVRVGGRSLFLASGLNSEFPQTADVLCLAPFGRRRDFENLLPRIRPRLVIPIHWDDFFRPLSRPLRMLPDPSNWIWPPMRRADLRAFEGMMREIIPDAKLLVPQVLETYDVQALLQR
ncbi:MAG TPA: MBL fold metallo-hydrolase [Anaerolineae bacterium]|nr:MBL fold metallo-hydrolase [Anaerolineae bacterium]